MAKRKRKYLTGTLRKKLWEAAGKKCAFCGEETTIFRKPFSYTGKYLRCAHVDHIVPFSMGGKCEEGNFRILCESCNLSRQNKNDIEYENYKKRISEMRCK